MLRITPCRLCHCSWNEWKEKKCSCGRRSNLEMGVFRKFQNSNKNIICKLLKYFFLCQPQVRRARPPRRSGCVSASPLKNPSEGLSRRTADVAIAAKPNSSLYSRSWDHAAVVSVCFVVLWNALFSCALLPLIQATDMNYHLEILRFVSDVNWHPGSPAPLPVLFNMSDVINIM